MLLLRSDILVWRSEVQTGGFQATYDSIFTKEQRMSCMPSASAPTSAIDAYKSSLAQGRSLPATKITGQPWSFFQVLPVGLRRRIIQHEQIWTRAGGVRGGRLGCVVNVTQTTQWARVSTDAPVLLRCSFLWLPEVRRPLLSLEHFELMGYRIWGADGETTTLGKSLQSVSTAKQRSMAGNGMHAASIGTVLMFLGSAVVFRPQTGGVGCTHVQP